MSKWCASGRLVLVALILNSCALIDLRKDILVGQPVWEDPKLLILLEPQGVSSAEKALAANPLQTGKPRYHSNTAGLGNLVRQVLGDKEFTFFQESNFLTGPDDTVLAQETTPLPPDIASNPVTKAMVRIILEECKQIKLTEKGALRHGAGQTDRLPRTTLSDDDFSELGKVLAKNFLAPRQRLLASAKKTKEGFLKERVEEKLTWTDIFVMYLMEYYNGKYVDRYGVAYEKPKLDFRITNDAIVAFANIFQESLWDYAFLGLVKDIKDPVVYKAEAIDQFINGTGKMPTFAKILREHTFLREHTKKPNIPGLVEVERTDKDKEGLGKKDVCVVHYFSGLSGDASEALSAMIIRTIGGSNLGFAVAYGKFSIGDNETLTKLIDATVKTFNKRSADLLFSTVLYREDVEKQLWAATEEKQDGWEWIEKHIKIADFLKCFDL